MSRIDDLLREHCPNGVGRRLLGSLGKRNKGTSITASKMKTIREDGGPVRDDVVRVARNRGPGVELSQIAKGSGSGFICSD